MKRKILKVFLTSLIIFMTYTLGSVIIIEFLYSSMGFNEHVYYTDVKSADEYGLTATDLYLDTSIKGKNEITHAMEVYTESPKAVVLYISGIQQPSVTYFFSHSKMLKENNYASILIENYGHGESSGDKITFGYYDIENVRAVVNYIKQEDKYKDVPIVVHGVSMGGAVALISASWIDDIDGLISMSTYSSWSDVCVDTLSLWGIPRVLTYIVKPSIIIHDFFIYGYDSIKYTPIYSVNKLQDKPVFFLHSYGDYTVPVSNLYRLLHKNFSINTHVWVRADKAHFIVKDNRLNEPFDDVVYCENILSYLEKYFG